jgi:hypothetical protein
MDPKNLAGATAKQFLKQENIAVRIKDIQVPEGAAPFVVGHRLDNQEEITIRLMTVAEAVQANTDSKKVDDVGYIDSITKRFEDSFVKNPADKRRPSLAKFADPADKVHCQEGGVMMFERAIKNEDGTYRAQWASNIAPTPKQEIMLVTLNLKFNEAKPEQNRKPSVFATILKPEAAIALTKDNRLDALHALLADKNSTGVPRNPAPVFMITDDHGGHQYAYVRTQTRQEIKKDFESGAEQTVVHVVDAPTAIAAILADQELNKNANGLRVKAVISGITGKDADWTGIPIEQRVKLDTLTKEIADGTTPVVAIPGEKMYAGPMVTTKLLADAVKLNNNPISKFAKYSSIQVEVDRDGAKMPVPLTQYAQAYIGIGRHPDTKTPYLRDVFPTTPFLNEKSFKKISNLNLGPNARIVAPEAVAELPETLDVGNEDFDAALAAAAAADGDFSPEPAFG